jgi:predicted MFS family arabinose efflux permease
MADCPNTGIGINADGMTTAEPGAVANTASYGELDRRDPLPWTAVAAVALAGFASFVNFWTTQPLLPLFTQLFSASKPAVGMTVSACTIAVALSAPFCGVLAERVGRKRVIVVSMVLLGIPVLLAGTAPTLGQLIFWRFLQGVVTPGIFGVTIATINEEWPASSAPKVMAIYLSGAVLGGFSGRVFSGYAATHKLFPGVTPSWRVGFFVMGICAFVFGIFLARWLPKDSKVGTRTLGVASSSNVFRHLRNPQLLATYAVGFNVLFSLVTAFTYINFHLAAPPYLLNPSQLSLVFLVYLVGLVVTPLAGVWIAKVGSRRSLMTAVLIGMAGISITLLQPFAAILLGLTLCSSAVFACQCSASSYIQVAAPAGERSSATGFYIAFYYLGGSVGGVLPGYLWHFGGWTACALLVLVVQALTIVTAAFAWKRDENGKAVTTGAFLPEG